MAGHTALFKNTKLRNLPSGEPVSTGFYSVFKPIDFCYVKV